MWCLFLILAMRSNAGMANRQGDVVLRFAQVSAPPLNTLAWLGTRGSSFGNGVTVHNTSRRKLSNTTWRQEARRPTAQPLCLVGRAHHRSSEHTASSPRPATTPATSCGGSPWTAGQAQPFIKRYTIIRGWPETSPRHHTVETSTERTSRFPSGRRVFTLHALL